MNNIKITWLGHACFIIEADSYRILIDPYQDGYVPGYRLPVQQVNEVICSHSHFDHNDITRAKLTPGGKNPFKVSVIETYHDNKKGSLRGCNKIHIFEAYGMRIVHFGDLGCALTEEEEALLKNADVTMIPTGGTYTLTAKEANDVVNRLSPHIVIPMHYRTQNYGFDVLEHIDDFTSLRHDVVYCDSNSVDVTQDSPCGCYVLKYMER